MSSSHVSDAILNEFLTLLKFASVSTDSQYNGDMRECADWIIQRFKRMGLDTELHETPGHPIVVARNKHQPNKKTILIYGHYDVQPVDPLNLWDHPPFEPHIENEVVFARGSTDNKGQFFAHMMGIEQTLQEHGELPVNLIFLVEGEEEIGSPNLTPFLKEHKDEFACDVIVISDTGMVSQGRPTFTYGLRGVSALEIKLTGPDHDLHSGIYGGAVANPAMVLSRLLTSLHDDDFKVAIEGFYDDVKDLEDWERKAWEKLPLSDEDYKGFTGAPRLDGEKGYTPVERVFARPTAEINGIGSGYQGEGTKTVLPSTAMAKLTFRLVPDQDPKKILDLAEAHLKKHCPSTVKMDLERGHSGNAYVVDPHSGFGKAAQSALQSAFPHGDLALIREGGSIPIVADFKEVLGVDTLLLGLALPDCRAHSPNENFPLENLAGGIELNKVLLKELAKTE